jgi:hypothetical protein
MKRSGRRPHNDHHIGAIFDKNKANEVLQDIGFEIVQAPRLTEFS